VQLSIDLGLIGLGCHDNYSAAFVGGFNYNVLITMKFFDCFKLLGRKIRFASAV